jgi:hypothetical protein
MQQSGLQPALETTYQTGNIVSVPTAADKRINAYGYDAFVKSSFVAVSPLTIASTGWDDATDIITSAAHGLYTGMVFRLTTTGALPTGVSAGTDYWVIRLTADTFALATTLANAQAGTKLNFTAAGSGNHTLTQQTDVATYVVEVSPDLTNWFTYDAMTPVSIVSNALASKHFESGAAHMRVKVAVAKGHLSALTVWIQGKG